VTRKTGLAPWQGVTPEPKLVHDGFVIAEVNTRGRRVPVGVPTGLWRGLWSAEGKLVVGVPGTRLLEVIPGRREVVLVRQELPAAASADGAPRAEFRWFCERWSLAGERLSTLELEVLRSIGWVSSLAFAKRDRGNIVKLICADEDRAYAFYVELATAGADRVVGPPAERAGKGKPVRPAKVAATPRRTTKPRI
jgi:hypothetical protein